MTKRQLEKLSRALEAVHQAAQDRGFDVFPNVVLQVLQHSLKIDMAWWGVNADRRIHFSTRLGLPARHAADWETTKDWDPIAEEAIARPRVTVMFNADRLQGLPRKRDWLSGYGISHAMCTTHPQPKLNITTFLSVYRRTQAFTENDRFFMQLLMPHLAMSLNVNWTKHLQDLGAHQTPGRASLAIIDRSGLIHSANDRFAGLVRLQWPTWEGPYLPKEWVLELQGPREELLATRVQATLTIAHELILLRLTRRSALLGLTTRERDTAIAFSEGRTHKQIAQSLGLAPATVRHYLQNAYSKLGVSNKGELGHLVALEIYEGSAFRNDAKSA